MQWEEFVSAFGHLRPGTYDINSRRYDADPEFFLRPAVDSQLTKDTRNTLNTETWEKEKSRFFDSLQGIGLPSDPHVVEEFLRNSIEGREYAKFSFSRNLSEAIECLAQLGLGHGLSREDLAELHVDEILALFNSSLDSIQILDSYALKIQKQRKKRLLASRLRLPNLITKEMDLDFFQDLWEICAKGAFLVSQEAIPRLLKHGGSLMFTGATASIRSKPPFTAFAAAKSAERSLAQGLAKEFGPQGIHVAHVIIDGIIDGDKVNLRFPEFASSKGEDGKLNIESIAENFLMLHKQQKSTWSFELDLRPWSENW